MALAVAAQDGIDSQGDCGCIVTANKSPVSKTYIEGILATTNTSSHPNHPGVGAVCKAHPRTFNGGSSKTFIEGEGAGRKGDSIACGDTLGTTATKTYIG
jgi:uncharacterized Zn-binding protein involved in type VI secretion